MFFDNLETPWAANQLTLRSNGVAQTGLYHNRNRSYLPSLGRFAQRDPNASATVPADAEWWNATKPTTWYPEIHIASLYGNGMSLHMPLLSSPTNHSDPAGSFIGGMVGMVGGMPESMDPYLDYNDEAMDAGMSMKDYIGMGLQAVAFDQYLDSFWAGDWSQPDDLYRGSASWSMGSGVWEGQESTGAFRSSPAMASAWTDTIKGGMSREAKGMGVYLILNEANEVIYAGRSVNLQKRMAQSQKIQGGARAIGIAVDSRATMRAMEDLMIRYHQQVGQAGKNMINGVSKLNDNRGAYYKSLKNFMSKLK